MHGHQNGLKTALLLASLAALFIFIGGAWGGQTGVVIAFGFAVVMNAVSYWFSDRIVLRMHNAQPVGPDHVLYRATQRMAQKAGLPMPRVYLIPSQSPNAFATGRNPSHAAVADAAIHDATAIVGHGVGGQQAGHGGPVAGCEVSPVALVLSTC